MIEYLVINVCLGSDSLCQGWLKQNCKKKKEKVQVLQQQQQQGKTQFLLETKVSIQFWNQNKHTCSNSR